MHEIVQQDDSFVPDMNNGVLDIRDDQRRLYGTIAYIRGLSDHPLRDQAPVVHTLEAALAPWPPLRKSLRRTKTNATRGTPDPTRTAPPLSTRSSTKSQGAQYPDRATPTRSRPYYRPDKRLIPAIGLGRRHPRCCHRSTTAMMCTSPQPALQEGSDGMSAHIYTL